MLLVRHVARRGLSTNSTLSSTTVENLKTAFAGSAMSAKRYLYFAQKADVEGLSEVSALFRSLAEGQTSHSLGHMEFLEAEAGDPVTDEPIGDSMSNLRSALSSEAFESSEMYPGMARTARDEGNEAAAQWFELLSQSQRNHWDRIDAALRELEQSERDGPGRFRR